MSVLLCLQAVFLISQATPLPVEIQDCKSILETKKISILFSDKRIMLDLSTILIDPQIINRIENSKIYFEGKVLVALTELKKLDTSEARAARIFLSIFDKMVGDQKYTTPMTIENGNTLQVVRKGISQATNEISVIASTQALNEAQGEPVVLLTTDHAVVLAAHENDLNVIRYQKPKPNLLPSIRDLRVSKRQLQSFKNDGQLWLDDPQAFHNQYLRLKTDLRMDNDDPAVVMARFDTAQELPELTGSEEETRAMMYSIQQGYLLPLISAKSHRALAVVARSNEQQAVLDALYDPSITLLFIEGAAGTGKTLLAMAAALDQAYFSPQARYDRVILSRSAGTMGGETHGHVPGDIHEKTDSLYLPIYDAIFKLRDLIQDHAELAVGNHFSSFLKLPMSIFKEINPRIADVDKLRVKREPLMNARGRSHRDLIWIVDEAQNLTPEQLAAIASRQAENSKIVIMGDPSQIDKPLTPETSGFVSIMEEYRGVINSAHVLLTKTERSPSAAIAAEINRILKSLNVQ